MERSGGAAQGSRCPDALTTLDMNACYGAQLERSEARLERYFVAALERVSADDSLTLLLRSTQEGWQAYRGGECGAVHESFEDGSIRTVMYLGCAIALTDERTHTIWQNWLTYPDSTPPVLPEPKR